MSLLAGDNPHTAALLLALELRKLAAGSEECSVPVVITTHDLRKWADVLEKCACQAKKAAVRPGAPTRLERLATALPVAVDPDLLVCDERERAYLSAPSSSPEATYFLMRLLNLRRAVTQAQSTWIPTKPVTPAERIPCDEVEPTDATSNAAPSDAPETT